MNWDESAAAVRRQTKHTTHTVYLYGRTEPTRLYIFVYIQRYNLNGIGWSDDGPYRYSDTMGFLAGIRGADMM